MSDPNLDADADELTQALNGLAESIGRERQRNDQLRAIVKGVVAALVVALVAAAIGIGAAVQASKAATKAKHAVECTNRTADKRTTDTVQYLAAEYQKVHNQGVGFSNLQTSLLHKDSAGAFAAIDTLVSATEGYANSRIILGKLQAYGVHIVKDSKGLVTVTVPKDLKIPSAC